MKNSLYSILLSGVFAVTLACCPAAAETPYRLKGNIEIKGTAISLADLVDGPSLPTEPVFAAPALGETGTIKIARIAAALKKANGQTLAPSADTQVRVTRRARILPDSEIAETVARKIARDYRIDAPDVRLQFDREQNGVAMEADASGPPIISNIKFDPQSLRFEAQMTLDDSAALLANPVQLTGYVMADRLVPVLNRTIEKGAAVTAGDIRMERRLRSTLTGKNLISANDLVGRVALTTLNAGDAVTDDLIGHPVLVEKGAFVSVIYEANGLLLSMRGRAEEAGAIGDTVSVTNLQSKKSLYGTVTAGGQIRINAMTMREARLAPQLSAPSFPIEPK